MEKTVGYPQEIRGDEKVWITGVVVNRGYSELLILVLINQGGWRTGENQGVRHGCALPYPQLSTVSTYYHHYH